MKKYDILTIGRSSIDLYANDIGAAFPDIKSFGAFVGGCPTNISVGVQRLGLRAALLTAVGKEGQGGGGEGENFENLFRVVTCTHNPHFYNTV